jgi:histidyl-tRNA synthetase
MAERLGAGERLNDFFTLLDKMDKIGSEKLIDEFSKAGFGKETVSGIRELLAHSGDPAGSMQMQMMEHYLAASETGMKGLWELKQIAGYSSDLGADREKLHFDFTLARGLAYYTGAIFEARVKDNTIGSVGGGGRYDNLTGVFGLPGISGVGFSFGIDRLYSVMEELSLFPGGELRGTRVLMTNFGEETEKFALGILTRFRENGINAEIYPESDKIRKQLEYANKRGIPFVIFIGTDEMKSGRFAVKNMNSGIQEELTIGEALQKLQVRE